MIMYAVKLSSAHLVPTKGTLSLSNGDLQTRVSIAVGHVINVRDSMKHLNLSYKLFYALFNVIFGQ